MNRIGTLDGWRAIAIILVTINHAAESIWVNRPDILYFTRFGALGVDVFFALSGVLITKLLLEEHDRTGGLDLKAFYIRRCFRVLLPCYVYVGAVWASSVVQNPIELLSSIFFFRNYLDGDFPGYYTAHLWSLAVEEHFYLLWPILLAFVTPKRGREVALWCAVCIGLWRVAGQAYSSSTAFALYRTDYRLDALLYGCVVAFLMHQSSTWKRIAPWMWAGLLVAYLLCLRYYSPLTRLWMPMILPMLIAATAAHPDWRLSRILELSPLRWIGKISYSLYLWQMIFLVQTAESPYWWQRFPANIVLALVTATVCYYVIDGPSQRLGQRLAKRMRASKAEGHGPTEPVIA